MSITDTLTLEYKFNDDGSIVGIRHDGYEQQYEYNAGQLSGANTQTGNYNYRYDVTGNRTVASATGSVDDYESVLNYNPIGKGNRLESRVDNNTGEDIVYRYNEAGSPIRIGDLRYHYNADQRPIKITRNGDVVAQYSYNSFGERIKNVTYSQNQKKVTYILYDNRTLVAEIDGDTLEYRQNIYLKNTPVAHLIGKTTYAVHTDNIGTPKLLTDSDGNTVWEAAHTPLGQAVIDKQDIPFNLRFPGQYADAETGTHYNYLRDYDPRTDRYLTSDPVGLEGGDNTYAYASNDVLGAIDVLGLSSQIAGLPGGIISGGNSDAAFSLDNASNGVQNPSTLTPDIAVLGITDLNQLVNDYRVANRGCQSTEADELLDEGIYRVTQFNQDLFLVGSDIDTALQRLNDYVSESTPIHPADQAIKEALESLRRNPNASFLLIPDCYDDEEVVELVTIHLGKLVHSSEIAAIIASLGEVDEYGCRPASAVDLTALHTEILSRFQVVVAIDDRVVAAENAMLLAQAALEEFESIHGKDVCAPTAIGESRDLCNQYFLLFSAAEDRAEEYAETLEYV